MRIRALSKHLKPSQYFLTFWFCSYQTCKLKFPSASDSSLAYEKPNNPSKSTSKTFSWSCKSNLFPFSKHVQNIAYIILFFATLKIFLWLFWRTKWKKKVHKGMPLQAVLIYIIILYLILSYISEAWWWIHFFYYIPLPPITKCVIYHSEFFSYFFYVYSLLTRKF